MTNLFTHGSVWQLIVSSDWISGLILLFLFFMSVVCIAIIGFKIIFFKRELRKLTQLMVRVKDARGFNDFISLRRDYKDSLGGKFLTNALADLKGVLGRHVGTEDVESFFRSGEASKKISLSSNEIAKLEIMIDQQVEHVLVEAEHYLPVLGTSAAVAPLIGLFGTVWGLIISFLSISQQKSADISVVAPGIAAALLTTFAGLVVAIPAMIFFHYLSNDLRTLERHIIYIADKFVMSAQHTFV